MSTARSLAVLADRDFSRTRQKLCQPLPEGKGWTPEQALEAERWYRRFLELCIKYPEVLLVPNQPIDDFWHMRILDTVAYAEDCQVIFGHFIHHHPYYGMNGDAVERDQSFDETNRLYHQEYGEDCRVLAEVFDSLEGVEEGELALAGTHCGGGCSKRF